MKPTSIASDDFIGGSLKPTRLERLARRALTDRLSGLRDGCLVLVENDRQHVFGDANAALKAVVRVLDPRFYAEVAFGGAVGGGEAYMRGYWQTECVTSVVRIFARNRDVLNHMDSGIGRLTRPLRRLFHRLNQNSRKGSRRNISAHYDVGNDFFELWLGLAHAVFFCVFSAVGR